MTTFGKQQSRANTDSRSAGGDLDESAGSKSRINIEQPVAPLVITRKPSSESKHVNNNIQKEEQNQKQEEILNIKVAEPPKKSIMRLTSRNQIPKMKILEHHL